MHVLVALSKRDFDQLLARGTEAEFADEVSLYRFESAKAPRGDDNVLLETRLPDPIDRPVLPPEVLAKFNSHGIPLSADVRRKVLAEADEWWLTHDPRRERLIRPTTLPRSRAWGATAAVLGTIGLLILAPIYTVIWPLVPLVGALAIWLVFQSVRRSAGAPTPPSRTLRPANPRILTRLAEPAS